MCRLRTDPHWLWLQQAWRDEIPTALHSSVRGKGVGDIRGDVYRLLDEKHMLWSPALTADDRLYWFPEDWLMPAHEGVKRLKQKYEHRWLRMALAYQGPPEDALLFIASEVGRPTNEVEGALLRLARQVSRIVGVRHDVTVPA